MYCMSAKNYYEILEIDVNSDSKEIKSAYRRLVRKYHPDVNKDPNSIKLFKTINCAYETLIDSSKRNQYDILNGIFKQEENTSTEENFKTDTNQNVKKTTRNFTQNDIKSSKNTKKNEKKTPNSILKLIKLYYLKLKKLKINNDRLKPKKGENITTDVIITPEEALTGGKRIINIRTIKTCPQCYGHRFTNGDKCLKCNGTGSVTETKKITITIPKGVKNGTKLRLRSEGASGKNGGANGDVIVIVKIEAKTQMHFDKLNIYYNIPINPFEAVLGEEITIPAIDGNIKLKLPKNTHSGQKFRLSGQGIKKNGKTGDLIVTVSIEISHNLSDDEIKLYEQLKNLSKDDMRKNFGYGS